MSPAKVHAICDREADTSDADRAAKVRFMRDYLTDIHFRSAADAFVASRAASGFKSLTQRKATP